MSKFVDVNARLAYLTRKANGAQKAALRPKRPIYLRNEIKKGAGLTTAGSAECSTEVEAFFLCLEDNEFLDAKCGPQLTALLDCDKSIQKTRRELKEKLRRGEEVSGMVHRSAINEQLKKYPNLTNKEALTIQGNLLNTLPNNRVHPFPHKNKWNPEPKNHNGLSDPE